MSTIEICPVCGKNTFHVEKDTNTYLKHAVCTECKCEHIVEDLPANIPYVQNLFYLKFFGNTYEHVVDASDLHNIQEAENKAKEIEQINGIQSIRIIVKDEDLGRPVMISGIMQER